MRGGAAFAALVGLIAVCAACGGKQQAPQGAVAPPDAPQPPAERVQVSISMAGDGSGRLVSNPLGIDCPGACRPSFPAGASFSLTPAADHGSTFAGFQGACAGLPVCTLSPSDAVEVTVTFVRDPAPPPPLPPSRRTTRTISVTVTGPGTVTSVPAGISCPG